MQDDAFEVVDADGTVRARLGLGPDGALSLDLADAAGMVRATLTVERVDSDLGALGIIAPTRLEVFASTGLIDDDKLEGLADSSPSVVALTNDNDFGIGDNKTGAPSKIWIVQLGQVLPVALRD
mgnify:FL=1